MTAATAPAGSRRHTTAVMRLARTMYADGDAFTITEIAGYLAANGDPVSRATVKRWVDDEWAQERREQQRQSIKARRARGRTPVLDRMRELRAGGLSFTSIAVVLRVDMGLELSTDAVRYYMRKGREPRLPKQRAAIT